VAHPKILRLRALAHRLAADLAEFDAELNAMLPRGAKVLVQERWRGKVSGYCVPQDGHVCITPESGEVGRNWPRAKNGDLFVHVDQIDLAQGGADATLQD
jgi:hypothetical protein